ncbi:hypothetical protein NHQ30_003389 [Ciborinia camelliae]|nr:hypothetical protein NHQ30_003389 [Ciborinia camelliae]
MVLEDPISSRHPSMDQINAWILRTLYLRSTTRPHVSWLASCTTLHLAEATGLHQEVHIVLVATEGDVQARRMDEADIERARTFLMACITCKPVENTIGDSTIFYIRLAQLIARDTMVTSSAAHKEELMNGLKRLAQIPDDDPFLSLSKANACFLLEKEEIQSIIGIGNRGAEEADFFAHNDHPWWNILSTTFQHFCVLLAIDTFESMSNLSWVLNIFQDIVRIVNSHLALEALGMAKVLLRNSMSKKRRDLGFLTNADSQDSPVVEAVGLNWDASFDPKVPDSLMSEDSSIYNT